MRSERRRRPADADLDVVVRPARPDEYDAVVDMVGRCFPPGDGASTIVEATLGRDSRFRAEHLRVAEVDGGLAGMMLFIDRVVRFGTSKVRCAIVAPLATDRSYQGQGVASRIMHDALGWATREGYHLTMLWGHTWLYPRYGYAPGLKTYAVTLDSQLRPLGDMGYTIRPAAPADSAALAMCYHLSTATTTLAELRSDEPWEWRPLSDRQFVEVAVDPVRSVRGYFRAAWSDERLEVREIAAMDDGASQTLFDRLLHLAAQRAASYEQGGDRRHPMVEVSVNATPDNRWSRWAFFHGASYCIDGGGGHGMARVLDMPGFFKAIRPELERRVGTSEFAGKNAGLRLETPLGSIGIAVDRGVLELDDGRGLPMVTLPWAAFGSLVVGYRSADSLVGQGGVRIEGEGTLRLLQALFPEGYPHWPVPAYFGGT